MYITIKKPLAWQQKTWQRGAVECIEETKARNSNKNVGIDKNINLVQWARDASNTIRAAATYIAILNGSHLLILIVFQL